MGFFDDSTTKGTFTIMDVKGKVIHQKNYSPLVFSRPKLHMFFKFDFDGRDIMPDGFYYVIFYTDKGDKFTGTVVVIK